MQMNYVSWNNERKQWRYHVYLQYWLWYGRLKNNTKRRKKKTILALQKIEKDEEEGKKRKIQMDDSDNEENIGNISIEIPIANKDASLKSLNDNNSSFELL